MPNEQLCESLPEIRAPAQWRASAFPAVHFHVGGESLLPYSFSSFARGDFPRFPRTKMNSCNAHRPMSRTGRSCQSLAIGIVRELPRAGVKINVNFAVELISPASINPTSSTVSLSLFFPVSLFPQRFLLYVCLSFSRSIYPFLLSSMVLATPALHYGHFLSSHAFTPPWTFLKLPETRKLSRWEKAPRISRPRQEAPVVPSVLSRIVLCRNPRAFCRDYLRQIVFLLWSSRVGIYPLCCVLFASKGLKGCHKIANTNYFTFAIWFCNSEHLLKKKIM